MKMEKCYGKNTYNLQPPMGDSFGGIFMIGIFFQKLGTVYKDMDTLLYKRGAAIGCYSLCEKGLSLHEQLKRTDIN